MTFGEMHQWTKRFNQIMGASITLRNKRLEAMINDIMESYDHDLSCTYVSGLFITLWEARNEVAI